VAHYHRLRDLFSFKPDLVLYDITSTYFEGAGPAGFAKHGHSRDGKPHNVQVIVAVVMVSGWPIAHHVWAGNELVPPGRVDLGGCPPRPPQIRICGSSRE